MDSQSNLYGFIPIFMQIIFAFGFVFATIWISGYLGPKRYGKNKNAHFECGINSIGDARLPFPVKYFLIALLFVLFDLEIIFLYPWVVNFIDQGWSELFKMLIFIGLLTIGYLYLRKKKAFDWED